MCFFFNILLFFYILFFFGGGLISHFIQYKVVLFTLFTLLCPFSDFRKMLVLLNSVISIYAAGPESLVHYFQKLLKLCLVIFFIHIIKLSLFSSEYLPIAGKKVNIFFY